MTRSLTRSLVELDMVRDLELPSQWHGEIHSGIDHPGCPLKDRMARDARTALLALEGVKGRYHLWRYDGRGAKKDHADGMPALPKLSQFNKVEHVLAIMSGKGGVGKSSVTAMLAVSLNRLGLKVGILDADITGPSIPRLFGLPSGGLRGSEQGILPSATRSGIKVMSTNLLVQDENLPVIWRGPMITGVIQQFWNDTLWGRLDFLLVDLPPGTSDAALTVTQQLPLQGVLLVTTPQELAAMVVKKAVSMVATVGIPMLGVVENMSYFRCPDTGKEYEIFGPSHAAEIASTAGCEVLARLPIQPEITRLGDAGLVEEAALPEFLDLAGRVERLASLLPPPREKK